MLQLIQVARSFAEQTIFEDVSLELSPHDRLGLVGENGSGKTTLLRLMAGLDAPDAGQMLSSGPVAYLPQQAEEWPGTLLDAALPPGIGAARLHLAQATDRLADPTPAHLDAFTRAEEAYRTLGGYDLEVQATAVLGGLGLGPQASAAQLSGGQVRRLLLARLLLVPAPVYLLDEPTNHLDEAGVRWLEHWLRGHPSAFVLASHDRAFLDSVCRRTAELERGHLSVYPGNYSAAMDLKARQLAAQARDHQAYRRKRGALALEEGRLRSAGESAGTFNHKRVGNTSLMAAKNKAEGASAALAGRARALERRLETLDAAAVARPYQDQRRLKLELPPVLPGPSEVLIVRNLSVRRGAQPVLCGVNLDLRRGEKVALVGENGSGKSSLLLALLRRLPGGDQVEGTVRLGAGLEVYFAGQGGEELSGFNTLADALLSANPQLTRHELYEFAAALWLPPDPATPVASLSGGQRTRLSLARLSVTRAQLLVLDEPTNHLDINAIELLEGTLQDFPGSVLLATHDQRSRQRVASRLWRVSGGGVWEE
jgi:ATPase subunit of ABC transporter with duplicated ATPase domains